MVTNRYREINRRYEKNHAACFYQQRRLITATIQFFDLFSGIGGFREGLRRAGGFTCVGHCEVDTYADKNYRLLFDTEGEWYCSDARTIEPERMPDFDLLCAGFPCQAFSIAGKREGFADARGTLFFEIARLLKAKRPQYFILENVPGLLSHDKGRTFCTILSTLSQLVWNCAVPKKEVNHYLEKYKVGNIKTTSDGAELRILSKVPPTENAVREESTLEDAFLLYFGEKAGD